MAHKKRKLPLLATAGAVVFGYNVYSKTKGTTGQGLVNQLQYYTVGIKADGSWDGAQFLKNIAPVVVGAVGSMVASRTGVNKMISAIPFVKM